MRRILGANRAHGGCGIRGGGGRRVVLATEFSTLFSVLSITFSITSSALPGALLAAPALCPGLAPSFTVPSADAPDPPPLRDHLPQQRRVGGAIRRVFLALIPQDPAYRVWCDARDHHGEGSGRAVLRVRGDGRRPGAFAVGGVELVPADVRISGSRRFNLRIPAVELGFPSERHFAAILLGVPGQRMLATLPVRPPGIAGFGGLLIHPTSDGRAADVAVDDANRHVGAELPTQTGREIVGDRAHGTTGVRRACLP